MDALGSVSALVPGLPPGLRPDRGLLDAAAALGGLLRPAGTAGTTRAGTVPPVDPVRGDAGARGRSVGDGSVRAVPAGLAGPDAVALSPEARAAADDPVRTGSTNEATDAAASTSDASGTSDADTAGAAGADGTPLTDEEQAQVDELKARDREVRTHEQAHKSAGGQYAGAISYQYQRGPDGRRYAVGGSVPIDVSPVPDDPPATIRKMQQVRRAALAPAEPSSADRQVAAQASRTESQARREQSQRAQAERTGGDEGAAAGTDRVSVAAPAASEPESVTARRRFESGVDPRSTTPVRSSTPLVDVVA